MAKTANQALFEATVRHQVHLLRFAEGQAQSALDALKSAEGELLERITGAMAKGLDPARLEALLTSVRQRRAQVYEQLGKDMEESLQGLAEADADWEASALKGSVPVQLNLASVPLEQLHAAVAAPIAGIPLKGWLDNIAASEASQLQAAVTQAVIQGQTIDDLVRRIRGTKAKGFADGILSTSTRNAQALARTAVNHVSNSAREEVWNANADIVRALRWTSTLDGRTTVICQSRDGHLAPLGESALLPTDHPLQPPGARPPAHFNCRSLMVAVLDGVELAGDRPFVADERTRAERERAFRQEAKDRGVPIQQVRKEWADKHVGSVPSATTYQEWLKGQPHSFQDEVLGRGRAQLFRDGVPLERFVDKSGKVLSLAELKAELAGDALNVVQPAIGVKAKGLLMQGLEPDQVLSAIKAEFPEASTTAASIASYKSELKKAGLLPEHPTLTPGQKYVTTGATGQLSIFESKLPEGLSGQVKGQWATVVDSLDGHPGAYAHYKPGVGVQISDAKLTGISQAQAQQVMAHELGHYLHKVHGILPPFGNIDLDDMMAHFKAMPPELRKLYGYYGVHRDELWAEVVGQAIHPSPVTSQGVAAQAFRQHFAQSIADAENAVKAAFPDAPPLPASGPVAPGLGEIAGKPTSIGGYAKALLQQGMPDEQVLAAVHAEFPLAKTTMNSIKSYKSELKKAEQAAIGTPGPTVHAHGSAAIEQPKPLPPVPEKLTGHADPASAPAPLAPSHDPVPLSGLTKVGGKPGGSNPGARYADAAGNEWLVKGNVQKVNGKVTAEMSDARARNEVLAARILRIHDAGIAPEMRLVDLEGQYGGGQGVMSRMLDKPMVKFDPANEAHLAAAQRDFALHAWIGNYDAVGASFDNLVMKGGKAVNIDPGGALLFRAQGLPKADFDEIADTWETMRQASKNAQAAKVYGPMSAEQLRESAKALLKYTDEVIDELVAGMGPDGVPISNYQLSSILKARRDDILKRAGLSKTLVGKELGADGLVKAEAKAPGLPVHDATTAQAIQESWDTASVMVGTLGEQGVAEAVAGSLNAKYGYALTAEDVLATLKAKPAAAVKLSPSEAYAKQQMKLLLENADGDHMVGSMGEVQLMDEVNQKLEGEGLPTLSMEQMQKLHAEVTSKAPSLEGVHPDQVPFLQEKVAHWEDLGLSPEEVKTNILAELSTMGAEIADVPDVDALYAALKKAPTGQSGLHQATKALSAADYKAMTPKELMDALVDPDLEIKSWQGKTAASYTIQKAAVPLFKAGLKTETVQEVLTLKFGPTHVPKVTSLASMKSKLKKLGMLDGPIGSPVPAAAKSLPQPKLWGKALGGKSTTVKEGAKNLIQQGQSADQVTAWIKTQFSSPNPQGAADLFELAKYEVVTGKASVKKGVAGVMKSYASLPTPQPLYPASTVGLDGPPPPRFSAEGRQAGLQKYGGLGMHESNSGNFAKINKAQKAAGLEELTPEEYSAIKAYTGSAYRAINEKMRTGTWASDPYAQAWADAAIHGLRKLPAWEGTTVRGITVDASTVKQLRQFYKPGAIVTETQFTSSSDAALGKGFSGNVRYRIKTKTGRDVLPVSSFKNEVEILLVPGSKYRVTKVEEKTGGYYHQGGLYIEMEEI